MSNVDNPKGFIPFKNVFTGGPVVKINRTYNVKASCAVYPGDAVCIADTGTASEVLSVLDGANGTYGVAATSAAGIILGVADRYISATDTDRAVGIYLALPGNYFLCQCSGTASDDMVGTCADITDTVGTTLTGAYGTTQGKSQQEIGTDKATSGNCRILGKTAYSAWGANTELVVEFAEGCFLTGTAGLTAS